MFRLSAGSCRHGTLPVLVAVVTEGARISTVSMFRVVGLDGAAHSPWMSPPAPRHGWQAPRWSRQMTSTSSSLAERALAAQRPTAWPAITAYQAFIPSTDCRRLEGRNAGRGRFHAEEFVGTRHGWGWRTGYDAPQVRSAAQRLHQLRRGLRRNGRAATILARRSAGSSTGRTGVGTGTGSVGLSASSSWPGRAPLPADCLPEAAGARFGAAGAAAVARGLRDLSSVSQRLSSSKAAQDGIAGTHSGWPSCKRAAPRLGMASVRAEDGAREHREVLMRTLEHARAQAIVEELLGEDAQTRLRPRWE